MCSFRGLTEILGSILNDSIGNRECLLGSSSRQMFLPRVPRLSNDLRSPLQVPPSPLVAMAKDRAESDRQASSEGLMIVLFTMNAPTTVRRSDDRTDVCTLIWKTSQTCSRQPHFRDASGIDTAVDQGSGFLGITSRPKCLEPTSKRKTSDASEALKCFYCAPKPSSPFSIPPPPWPGSPVDVRGTLRKS